MRCRVAALVALSGLMACATPRNGLNTASSSCFRALPAAEAAVQRKGSLVGVRKVAKDELARALPQASRVEPQVVCAVAFRAAYNPGDVVGADPAGPGRFAIVVLDAREPKVLAAFVVDTLPVRFHHRV